MLWPDRAFDSCLQSDLALNGSEAEGDHVV